jgi:hypothetical protein
MRFRSAYTLVHKETERRFQSDSSPSKSLHSRSASRDPLAPAERSTFIAHNWERETSLQIYFNVTSIFITVSFFVCFLGVVRPMIVIQAFLRLKLKVTKIARIFFFHVQIFLTFRSILKLTTCEILTDRSLKFCGSSMFRILKFRLRFSARM